MPQFDYLAARKAGVSDAQISQFLTSQKAAGNELSISPHDYAQGQRMYGGAKPAGGFGDMGDPLHPDSKVANFGIGAIKGVADTVNTVGSGGQKALSFLTGVKPNSPTRLAPKELTTPDPGQKAGYATEQTGEFFAGDEVAKGFQTTIEAAVKAGQYTPEIAKALNFAAKSLFSGSETAAVTAAQGGNAKETKDAGLFGTLGPAAEHVVSMVGTAAKELVSNTARQIVNSVFDRTFGERLKDIKLGDKGFASFADKYLKDGKWFASAKSARTTIEKKILPEAGKGLETLASGPLGKKSIVTVDIQQALNDGYKQLKDILGSDNPLMQKIKNFQAQILNFKDAHELKQAIYEYLPRNAYNDARLSAIADRLKTAASTLNERLTKAAGGVDSEYAKLNKTYGLFKETLTSLQEKAARKISSVDKNIAGIGAGATAITHNPAVAAGTAGLLATEKAISSVPGGLLAAFGLNKLAPKLETMAKNPAVSTFLKALASEVAKHGNSQQ
jgi:hypothetical protein